MFVTTRVVRRRAANDVQRQRCVGDEPPFPSPDDEQMPGILEETLERFSEGEEPGAIAFAAALGWQAGRNAGLDCPGCAPESHQDPLARAMRAGTAEMRFHA
jgi:hypothetical protein